MALPLQGTFHPAGFLLRIRTNSQHVLDAATESWGDYPEQLHSDDALEFRVVVQDVPQSGGVLCGVPRHRVQGHLCSVVSDADNFASLDLTALQAAIYISQRTAEDHAWLRWSFVESLAYLLLAQRSVVPVHAACVARNGSGILLCGASEAGKSTLAYACAREGWTYLSDDAVFLLPDSIAPVAIGRHRQVRFRPDAPRLFPELEPFASRLRPNGKMAIEVPVRELTHVHAAASTTLTHVVLLDRNESAGAAMQPVPSQALLDRMLADIPSYGAEVDAMHERSIARLLTLPTLRLRYSSLEGALQCLAQLTAPQLISATR